MHVLFTSCIAHLHLPCFALPLSPRWVPRRGSDRRRTKLCRGLASKVRHASCRGLDEWLYRVWVRLQGNARGATRTRTDMLAWLPMPRIHSRTRLLAIIRTSLANVVPICIHRSFAQSLTQILICDRKTAYLAMFSGEKNVMLVPIAFTSNQHGDISPMRPFSYSLLPDSSTHAHFTFATPRVTCVHLLTPLRLVDSCTFALTGDLAHLPNHICVLDAFQARRTSCLCPLRSPRTTSRRSLSWI